MKIVSRVASSLVVLAWLVFMFAGFRSNAMLRDTRHMPVSYCQSRPTEFQMADMKAPVCVERSAARRWADNQRLLTAAGAVTAILFLAFLGNQLLSRRNRRAS